MKVERDKSDIDEISGASMRFNPYDPYFVYTENDTIKSEVILTNVVELLDLNTEWGKKIMTGRSSRPETVTFCGIGSMCASGGIRPSLMSPW